jgi:multidrug efflux pump
MGIFAYGRLSQAEDPPFTFKADGDPHLLAGRHGPPGRTATDRQDREEAAGNAEYRPRSSYSRPGESTVMFFAKDNTPPAVPGGVLPGTQKNWRHPPHPARRGSGAFFNDEYGDVFGNIYALTAEGFDYPQLKDAAERIRDDLLRVPGVGKVEIFGIQDEKIFVELSNAKLATLGIDQSIIVQALSQQNTVAGAGFFETRASASRFAQAAPSIPCRPSLIP